ncbi:MAG: aldehyde dehydrogenase family protein, partial [candidate division Zixibacteria bacterium]|nr:aldehyde dehydrogenase family protein [candidate division Zixibacteria bacterium]
MKINGFTETLRELELGGTNLGASDGVDWFANGAETESISPINGQVIAKIKQADAGDFDRI